MFTYYGDNRSPGRELHDTQRCSNFLLHDAFEHGRGCADQRRRVPPFLFEKAAPGRRIMFRGLLAKKRYPDGLQLWTFQVNGPAQRFYERHGFIALERTNGSGNEEHEPDIRYV